MPIDQSSNLYYEVSGPETAKSIVFLHGGGLAGWMWRKQVQALQAEYHCVVPDMPEQGKNTRTDTTPFTTEGAADRIAQLIRSQAHDGKAHVVGLSEGAQVVVSLLSRSPEVIDHAVVSSAILRPLWVTKFYPRWAIVWSYRWFVAPFKNNDWWIRLNMRGNGISDDYFADFKGSFQETTEASMLNMMLAGFRFRMPAGLEKADVPVLVAAGRKEYTAMKQSALDLLKVLPGARGVMVSLGPKSSLVKEHSWAMTVPDLFTATIKAWIEDHPLPAELLPLSL